MSGILEPRPGSRVWRLDLPLMRPLSMNDREHRMVKHRRVAQTRRDAALLAKSLKIPPLYRVKIELHYCPRDARRRDALNLVATLKPCEDGIVDAGVIPDDTEQWSLPTMPVIDPPNGLATVRLYLLVSELDQWQGPTS